MTYSFILINNETNEKESELEILGIFGGGWEPVAKSLLGFEAETALHGMTSNSVYALVNQQLFMLASQQHVRADTILSFDETQSYRAATLCNENDSAHVTKKADLLVKVLQLIAHAALDFPECRWYSEDMLE